MNTRTDENIGGQNKVGLLQFWRLEKQKSEINSYELSIWGMNSKFVIFIAVEKIWRSWS